jgi:hypothetical protein
VGREKDVGRSNNNGDHSGDPLRAKAEDPQVLWEEYEYRHSLVWKVIVQITTGVVVLSVVPYVANETIVERLQVGVLAAPALAFVLALFAVLVINNELDILDTIRREHRKQHREILGICYDTDRGDGTDRSVFRRWVKAYLLLLQRAHFRGFVNVYLLVLSMLSFVNGVICAILWVPYF